MFITELSIKRPTVSWVMSLILIIFGLFVFWKLPVRELPNGIQPPVVQVQVDYKSASASIVDQEVTQVVEDVIGGAEGIKNIDSKSENGRSTINVEFDTSINLDNAANDIRERVARVVDNLPAESDPPQILKRAAGFTTTMWLSLSSSTWSDLELGDYAERYLVDQFSSVKNVGRIRVGGLRELSIRVWIDPIKLAANDLTIKEVETAMRGENISLPAGTLEADNIDLTLNLDKSYNDINTIKQLPIKKLDNRVILLSDVANIEFGPVSEKTLFKAQTKDQINLKTVGIGIYARSGASTVELSNDIKKKLIEVKKSLPVDIAVCAAAVSDWRAANPQQAKLKKLSTDHAPLMQLDLCENPDILALLAKSDKRPNLIIGFAAETENLLENATAKRENKQCDWIVANLVGEKNDPIFGSDQNSVILVTKTEVENWPQMLKTELAEKLAQKIEMELVK